MPIGGCTFYRLRNEKERLNYELAFARQRSERATGAESDDGAESSLHSAHAPTAAHGGAHQPERGGPLFLRGSPRASRRTHTHGRSKASVSSGASSCASELGQHLLELNEIHAPSRHIEALLLANAAFRVATPPPRPLSLAREEGLWRTLERSGIVPSAGPPAESAAEPASLMSQTTSDEAEANVLKQRKVPVASPATEL